jgi:hypothetical protein
MDANVVYPGDMLAHTVHGMNLVPMPSGFNFLAPMVPTNPNPAPEPAPPSSTSLGRLAELYSYLDACKDPSYIERYKQVRLVRRAS